MAKMFLRTHLSSRLDREQFDLIFVASSECREIPVQDDATTVQPDTSLATRYALVADLERDALLQVARDLADLDATKEGYLDLHDDLDPEVYFIVVDGNLHRRYSIIGYRIVKQECLPQWDRC